jgi:diguanylate cyclase (GGDEF)-like protein
MTPQPLATDNELQQRTLWITWSLGSLVVTVLCLIIFVNERDQRLNVANDDLSHQVAYLTHVLETTLSTGNYVEARQQVEAWGRLHKDVSFVQLVADNGFVLADFRRERQDARKHYKDSILRYSYRDGATLRVEKSLEPVYQALTALAWQLAGTFVILELTVLGLLHQFSRYRQQARLTAQEYQRRLDAQQALERMATLDALTDLPNRYMLDEQLSLRVTESARFERRLALLFVDIDNFKNINDSFGHETGDMVLKTAAERMRACLRGYDLLARFGGDEFVLLLSNVDEVAEIECVAGKINQTLTPRMIVAERELFISASIGISLFPDDAESPGDLLRTADAAMYSAKEAGRNCHRFYTASMNASLSHRHEIETGLHTALQQKALFLVYQPQVDLRTGAIPSCEALIRWQHGDHAITPEEFIPIAEQSALMKRLQAFVIDEAARQRAVWLKQGFRDFRVDVNVSGGKSVVGEVFEQLETALHQHGLSHDHLGIELTEHTLVDAAEATIEGLSSMREEGLKVSLDDFGTGYSSLSYLKQLPVDTLKIDRGFIADVPQGRMDSAIVKAIISMGASMGKTTLAEGVESQAQLDFVRNAGCDLAQGRYLHAPLPAEALTELLQKNRATGLTARVSESGR